MSESILDSNACHLKFNVQIFPVLTYFTRMQKLSLKNADQEKDIINVGILKSLEAIQDGDDD